MHKAIVTVAAIVIGAYLLWPDADESYEEPAKPVRNTDRRAPPPSTSQTVMPETPWRVADPANRFRPLRQQTRSPAQPAPGYDFRSGGPYTYDDTAAARAHADAPYASYGYGGFDPGPSYRFRPLPPPKKDAFRYDGGYRPPPYPTPATSPSATTYPESGVSRVPAWSPRKPVPIAPEKNLSVVSRIFLKIIRHRSLSLRTGKSRAFFGKPSREWAIGNAFTRVFGERTASVDVTSSL